MFKNWAGFIRSRAGKEILQNYDEWKTYSMSYDSSCHLIGYKDGNETFDYIRICTSNFCDSCETSKISGSDTIVYDIYCDKKGAEPYVVQPKHIVEKWYNLLFNKGLIHKSFKLKWFDNDSPYIEIKRSESENITVSQFYISFCMIRLIRDEPYFIKAFFILYKSGINFSNSFLAVQHIIYNHNHMFNPFCDYSLGYPYTLPRIKNVFDEVKKYLSEKFDIEQFWDGTKYLNSNHFLGVYNKDKVSELLYKKGLPAEFSWDNFGKCFLHYANKKFNVLLNTEYESDERLIEAWQEYFINNGMTKKKEVY